MKQDPKKIISDKLKDIEGRKTVQIPSPQERRESLLKRYARLQAINNALEESLLEQEESDEWKKIVITDPSDESVVIGEIDVDTIEFSDDDIDAMFSDDEEDDIEDDEENESD